MLDIDYMRKRFFSCLRVPPVESRGSMKSWLKYFWVVIKHKWFVFLACFRLGVPLWRALVHDWTKLLPWNFFPYARQFYGDKTKPAKFASAWLRHQNRHDHHWEFWIPRTGHNLGDGEYGDMIPIRMPMVCVREMVADWLAAGRAYEGKWPDLRNWTWFERNSEKIMSHVHPHTAYDIGSVMDDLLMRTKGAKPDGA